MILGGLVAGAVVALGCGFAANNYRLAFLVSLLAAGLELVLIRAGGAPGTVVWIGVAIPACACLYYARRAAMHMGD